MFVKEVFQPITQQNEFDDRYITMNLTTEQIHQMIYRYTTLFKLLKSFETFCTQCKAPFLSERTTRKKRGPPNNPSHVRARCLRVLKDEYHGKRVKNKKKAISYAFFRSYCHQ